MYLLSIAMGFKPIAMDKIEPLMGNQLKYSYVSLKLKFLFFLKKLLQKGAIHPH